MEIEHFLGKARFDRVRQVHGKDASEIVARAVVAFSCAHPVNHLLVMDRIRRVKGDGRDPVEGTARWNRDR
jgi:hypothetical protein